MNNRKIVKSILILVGIFVIMKVVALKTMEDENIDSDNPYLKSIRLSGKYPTTIYGKIIKPVIDSILSFFGLLFLFPIFALISIVIFIDDPGTIFFKQKRIGRNGRFFFMHKFRTMKKDAPHDIPTHQLSNPGQYITKAGSVLRKTSLDELPQIWDIFRGKMSIIGPRPALWNQDDLIEQRERYYANSILPGLTGWAQINGRDEVEISEKAKMDGEYAKVLNSGSWNAFGKDIRCFIETIYSVLTSKNVMEGGTGNRKF